MFRAHVSLNRDHLLDLLQLVVGLEHAQRGRGRHPPGPNPR
jgi:hypothetical protein